MNTCTNNMDQVIGMVFGGAVIVMICVMVVLVIVLCSRAAK